MANYQDWRNDIRSGINPEVKFLFEPMNQIDTTTHRPKNWGTATRNRTKENQGEYREMPLGTDCCLIHWL